MAGVVVFESMNSALPDTVPPGPVIFTGPLPRKIVTGMAPNKG